MSTRYRDIPPSDRLLRGIRVSESGCWEWQKFIDKCGYGRMKAFGQDLAHRVAYLMFVGPIPEGMEIDHLCNVRHCVNPEHLEPVTHAENVRRTGARMTHCIRGHEFTPENTAYNNRGGRACRACHRLRNNARNAEKRRLRDGQ